MGDRALVQMTSGNDVSPVLYLHWKGSDVLDILKRTREQMKGRAGDVSYAFARLVQQATMDDHGNLSIGVWNATEKLKAADSHGDAGCFVVDVTEEWNVAIGGGYGLDGNGDMEESMPDVYEGFALSKLD